MLKSWNELIIENEYQRGLQWYRSENREPEGLKNMGQWKREALQKCKETNKNSPKNIL